jgi:hypothetical protein
MVDINLCTYFPCDCAAITDQADTGFPVDRGNQYKQTEHNIKHSSIYIVLKNDPSTRLVLSTCVFTLHIKHSHAMSNVLGHN